VAKLWHSADEIFCCFDQRTRPGATWAMRSQNVASNETTRRYVFWIWRKKQLHVPPLSATAPCKLSSRRSGQGVQNRITPPRRLDLKKRTRLSAASDESHVKVSRIALKPRSLASTISNNGAYTEGRQIATWREEMSATMRLAFNIPQEITRLHCDVIYHLLIQFAEINRAK